MQVFKFGGAALKDASNIQNVGQIIQAHQASIRFIVISALGKTTNALEVIINKYVNQDNSYQEAIDNLFHEHIHIIEGLFSVQNQAFILPKILQFQKEIHSFFNLNKEANYTFIYDQIVPYGELLSSSIVSAYLDSIGISNKWIDARDMIATDNNYTEAKVDFTKSEPLIHQFMDASTINITQGFIARNENGYSTTLGREGSDYTAAVISYCINASKMLIWKDVPAVLNADPRLFNDTIAIPELSYREAIEMTFYGAQVIHPKTIKPLQNKNIPLLVKSFIDKNAIGTTIGGSKINEHIEYPPIIVYKTDQVLLSISVKDFSFIAEENLSHIFRIFSTNGLRIHMTHSGAISFSACVENKPERIKSLLKDLAHNYDVKYNESLELLTIRHYTAEKIEALTRNKNILLTHKTRTTIQLLMRSE